MKRKSALGDPVLVLNKVWQVTAISTVKECFKTLFTNKARVVDADFQLYNFESWAALEVDDDEPYVKTVNNKIRAPKTLLLWEYTKLPTRNLKYSAVHVHKRDRNTCQYCGTHPGKNGVDRNDMTIDHVIPRAQGGKTLWTNCVVACWPCDHKKDNRTPEEAGMKLLKKPVRPKWTSREVFVRIGGDHGGGGHSEWKPFMGGK